jgi:hypothetical protein
MVENIAYGIQIRLPYQLAWMEAGRQDDNRV